MKKVLSLLLVCALLLGSSNIAMAAQPEASAIEVINMQSASTRKTLTLGKLKVKPTQDATIPEDIRYNLKLKTPVLPEPIFSAELKEAAVAVFAADTEDFSDENAILLGGLKELTAFSPRKNASFFVVINALFEGESEYTRFAIKLTYNVPITLSVEGTPKQGESFLLRADYLPEGESVSVTATTDMGFTPTFYPYKGSVIALMPAKYSDKAGTYHITLACDELAEEFTINVADGKFIVQVQNFSIDKSVADATVNNDVANDVYEEVTRPLKNLGDPEKYWRGKFKLPLKAENISTSSSFGIIRIINGEKSQHAGIDYPAKTGTPVYAPNNGRVLFAGFLQLTGNMVCIEHGFGLKSWYYHMSSVSVKAGDMVKTGDEIGKVGATGFVTGPHLHFTMSINNVYVNPLQFLENDVLK